MPKHGAQNRAQGVILAFICPYLEQISIFSNETQFYSIDMMKLRIISKGQLRRFNMKIILKFH